MNHRGSALLLAVLLALVLLSVAAFALMRPSSGSAAPGSSGGASVNVTVSLARTPTGMTATVVLTNNRSEEVKNLRISKATVGSMSTTTSLPINLGRLPRGASTTFTIPFTGPAPSPDVPMSADITCDYEFGWSGKGSTSAGTTLLRP